MKKFKEQEADLQERISEKSQDHEKRKSELETKRGIIQVRIYYLVLIKTKVDCLVSLHVPSYLHPESWMIKKFR